MIVNAVNFKVGRLELWQWKEESWPAAGPIELMDGAAQSVARIADRKTALVLTSQFSIRHGWRPVRVGSGGRRGEKKRMKRQNLKEREREERKKKTNS